MKYERERKRQRFQYLHLTVKKKTNFLRKKSEIKKINPALKYAIIIATV